VINDDQSTIWLTMQSGYKVASLDTQSGTIREYEFSGGPYGLCTDEAGHI
jgi:streptogramin lyase